MWGERSLRPPDVPNDNTPTEAAPGTVGPPSATPGDPFGFVVNMGAQIPAPPSLGRPAAWSGWPAEWNTPAWGGSVDQLADTAWACLDLNASVLASMPPYLTGAAAGLPADWLNNPDPDLYASWEDFAKQLWWEYQLGEAFILATAYYANGYPARFHVVEQWAMNVEMDGARRVYSIGGRDVTGDVLQIRYRTRTGRARGEGPLDAGHARMVAAEVLQRYSTNLAASGGVPPGTLDHPDELSADQAEQLKQQWLDARMSSIGLPAVLSGGVKWNPSSVSPADMALVELAQFNDGRIAVLFGVPPFLVGLPSGGDSMTYSSVVSLFDYHWRAGLRPKAQAVCSAVAGWALPRGTGFEVNRDEYVRPDPYTRAQTWNLAIAGGWMTIEEVRDAERLARGIPAPMPQGVLA